MLEVCVRSINLFVVSILLSFAIIGAWYVGRNLAPTDTARQNITALIMIPFGVAYAWLGRQSVADYAEWSGVPIEPTLIAWVKLITLQALMIGATIYVAGIHDTHLRRLLITALCCCIPLAPMMLHWFVKWSAETYSPPQEHQRSTY